MSVSVYVLDNPKWGYTGILLMVVVIAYFALDLRFHLSLLHLNLGLTRKQWDFVAWGLISLGIFGALLSYRGFVTCRVDSDSLRLEYLLPRPSVRVPFEKLKGYQVRIPPKSPENRWLVLILKDGRWYQSTSTGPEEIHPLLEVLKRHGISERPAEKGTGFRGNEVIQ